MKKTLSVALAMILSLSLLAACGGNEAPSTAGTEPSPSQTEATTAATAPESTPDAAKRDSINLYVGTNPTTFDPYYQAGSDFFGLSQIYDVLVYPRDDHSIDCHLAERYEISEDGIVYTFYLRQGVKFHNGEELKASDVVFTVERALTSPFLANTVAGIASCNKVDDYTVEIHLEGPNAPFLENLGYLFIVNEKTVTEAGDSYAENPVGTGPYMLVSHEDDVQFTLTRFDDYFRGPARIKDVVVRIISDQNTATIAMQAGEIDFGFFSPSAYDNIKNDPNLLTHQWPGESFSFVIMNHEVAPFDNALVRQAVNYAIDRDYMIDVNENGFAVPISTLLPSTILGYSDKIDKTYSYDPDRARELIAQSGITTPLDIGTIVTGASDKSTAQVLQQNLADIGLNATIEQLEGGKLFGDLADGNYTIGVMVAGLSLDADSFAMLLTTGYIGSLNFARYSNPAVDDLFSQARVGSDKAAREDIYAQIFNTVGEDAVYAPAYNPTKTVAYHKDLKVDYFAPNTTLIYEMSW